MRRIPRAIPALISVAASFALVAAGAVPALGADHRERVLVEGAPLVGGSNGMFFDADNNLYVAQVWGRSISKLDPETGEILEHLGPADSVFLPDDVTVGPDGTLFWTDPGVGAVFARRPGGPSVPLPLGAAYPSANPLTLSDDGTRLFFAQCYGAGPNGVYQLDFTTWATTPILQGIPGCASNAMDYRDGALYSPRPFEGRVVRVDLATKAVTNVTTVPVSPWGGPFRAENGVVSADAVSSWSVAGRQQSGAGSHVVGPSLLLRERGSDSPFPSDSRGHYSGQSEDRIVGGGCRGAGGHGRPGAGRRPGGCP